MIYHNEYKFLIFIDGFCPLNAGKKAKRPFSFSFLYFC